jgi:hypothetical protein
MDNERLGLNVKLDKGTGTDITNSNLLVRILLETPFRISTSLFEGWHFGELAIEDRIFSYFRDNVALNLTSTHTA